LGKRFKKTAIVLFFPMYIHEELTVSPVNKRLVSKS